MEPLRLFRALADPTRLRILLLVRRMELAVGELAAVVEQSQPRVSRHVRILAEAGLVERRKEGNWVFLARTAGSPQNEAVDTLIGQEQGASGGLWAEHDADLARLSAVRDQRARQAETYFADHAAEWDAIRKLHVADATVEAELAALLGGGSLGRLLDIGTGTGRMAELFGPQSVHATALDRSPEMLRLARARLDHLPPERLSLRQGDFAELPFDGASFDTVLLHQVLHFAQEPDAVIAEAARVTAPGGRIAIVDFAPHDREELRSRDAHARLGFADPQVEQMARRACLRVESSRTLAGRELTIKIWMLSHRQAQTPGILPARSAMRTATAMTRSLSGSC